MRDFDLLKRQLVFLQKSRASAEKAIKIFEGEMKKFKSGSSFESAKSAFERVNQRIAGIDNMLSRVQRELSFAAGKKNRELKARKKGRISKKRE